MHLGRDVGKESLITMGIIPSKHRVNAGGAPLPKTQDLCRVGFLAHNIDNFTTSFHVAECACHSIPHKLLVGLRSLGPSEVLKDDALLKGGFKALGRTVACCG